MIALYEKDALILNGEIFYLASSLNNLSFPTDFKCNSSHILNLYICLDVFLDILLGSIYLWLIFEPEPSYLITITLKYILNFQ